MDITDQESQDIKQVYRNLPNTLKVEKSALDWKKHPTTVTEVVVPIEIALDTGLPPKYEKEVYEAKRNALCQPDYDGYSGKGCSVYESASGLDHSALL